MMKYCLIVILLSMSALPSQDTNSLELKKAICLKRSPGEAVFCGLLLPGGAALYNKKRHDLYWHVAFQAVIPATLFLTATSENKKNYYTIAISSLVVSKLWDMYKGLVDARAYNEKMFYSTD